RRGAGDAAVARPRPHAARRQDPRRGRQSPHGAVGRHRHVGPVLVHLRARQSDPVPDRRVGRRARHHPRAVLCRAAARRRRYRVQVPAAAIRLVLHLCADAGDIADRAQGPVRRDRPRVSDMPAPSLAAAAPPPAHDAALPEGVRLFALATDLILGYGGVITLGQAAFFGAGAYACGLLSAHGWTEPLSLLVVAAVAAALVGFLSGFVVLRTAGLTQLMLTLIVAVMLQEAANKASPVTGGANGLQGMVISPILGVFDFDLYGHVAYLYCLILLFLG